MTPIKGKILDQEDQPFVQAHLKVLGTNIVTITDFNGYYRVSASGEAILEYSFVGFVKQSLPVNGRTKIDVTLKEDILQMRPIGVRILGDEYRDKDFTGRDICKARDIDLYFNRRDHRFSSSGLRERVYEAS